jgi:hypothetical protein
MRIESSTVMSKGRTRRRPSDAWFAAHTLEQSRAWLTVAENYERCGFGTPKLRYIARRMRGRIAELESSARQPTGVEGHSVFPGLIVGRA